jgi:hypothetical protein
MNTNPNISLQIKLLRGIALVLFTGLPGIILPGQALEKFSWFVGYGQPRLDPLSVFMTADAAYASVALATLLWYISRDTQRYQPLVRLVAWIFIIASAVFLSVGLQCPLPVWWTVSACLGCFAVGFGLLRSCGDSHLSHPLS